MNGVINHLGSHSPLVSIVIACRNEQAFIEGSVRALLAGTIGDIEIIVVDGVSTDGTHSVLQCLLNEDERVRTVENPRRITPVAFNLGVSAARGQFVAICGAHSIPAPDWIERNLQALAEHPEAVAVGGVLTTRSRTSVGSVIAAVMSSRFGVGNARFRTGGAPGFVDTVVFGCYRRAAFLHGLFDETLATNQDDEFNTRLIAHGERLWFDPAISCVYFCRPSWQSMLRQYWRYGRYKLLVFQKARRVGSWRQLVPAAWVALLAGLLFGNHTRILSRGVGTLYVGSGLLASFAHVQRLRAGTILFVPIAASLHLAYGLGFWAGVLSSLTRKLFRL